MTVWLKPRGASGRVLWEAFEDAEDDEWGPVVGLDTPLAEA